MKKIVALIMCSVILLAALVSCAEVPDGDPTDSSSAGPSPEESTPANVNDQQYEPLKRKLAGDLSIYLSQKARLCENMYWVLDYVEAFYSAPDWRSFGEARAALSAMITKLKTVEFPSYSVTPEQHAELILAGYDVSGFWAELNSLESERSDLLDNCYSLSDGLYYDAFFEPYFDNSKEYAALVRDFIDAKLCIMSAFTDNMMFALKSDKIKQDFKAYLQENIPLVSDRLPEYSEDLASLRLNEKEALDMLNERVDKLNILVGKMQVAFDQVSNSGDLRQFKMDYSDEATLFPLPTVFDIKETKFFYSYMESDESFTNVLPGEPISFLPNVCQVHFDCVDDMMYKKYFLMLADLGIEPVLIDDTDNVYKSYYMIGDATVIVKYENGRLVISIMDEYVPLVPTSYYE